MEMDSSRFVENVFLRSLEGLQPEKLIDSKLKFCKEKGARLLSENGFISLEGNCYVVGFGKAVLGLASSLLN